MVLILRLSMMMIPLQPYFYALDIPGRIDLLLPSVLMLNLPISDGEFQSGCIIPLNGARTHEMCSKIKV